MNPLDVMVAQGVQIVLERDLGPATYEKVERECQKMYGCSVRDAVADFAKMDMVLRRFFGQHTSNIEAKIFRRVLTAINDTGEEAGVSILEPTVASRLLQAYGDPTKKIMLDLAASRPRSISDMIGAADLPQASTYIRVRRMIQDGLLRKVGYTRASDGRKVSTYGSTITSILFENRDDGLRVDARVPQDVVRYSYAFNSVVV